MAAPFSILAYGENAHKCQCWKSTVHAEEKAIMNLPSLRRKKHLKSVDIVVIRTTKTGIFGNSQPCQHCMSVMEYQLPLKGYKLDKIYYTNSVGDIVVTTFAALSKKEPHMSSFYRGRALGIKY